MKGAFMLYMRTGQIRTLILSTLLVFASLSIKSQECLITVTSTDGYTVEIVLTPTQIIAPDDCPFGYNYNVEFTYDITFSGSNIPSGLWTLQGTMDCADDAGIFFPLPNSGGTGTGTTIGNPWNPNTDCATATVESLGCTTFNVQIHGPGIPNQTVTCEAALPISLESFVARPTSDGVEIEWETSTEINNDYFNLQRSTDGRNWETIQKIAGAGTTGIAQEYSYIDREASAGENFYQLTQVDFNGLEISSDIVSVRISRDNTLRAYPNPVSDHMFVENVSGILSVYNQVGANVLELSFGNEKQNVKMDLSELGSGIYFLRQGGTVVKFMKY